MKRNTKLIVIVLLLLTIGFATVTTTLVIRTNVTVKEKSSDFDVYFSKVLVNDTLDNSLITDKTHIDFNTSMKNIGTEYKLEYSIYNSSTNYDASFTIECTESNDYISVINTIDTANIESLETRVGTLKIKQIRSKTKTNVTYPISCTIVSNPVEKTLE